MATQCKYQIINGLHRYQQEKAGILTYSSSKGAFIGASVNGAELQQDNRLRQRGFLQGHLPR
jgi:lipid-binding SYLF domain-containing protein